MSQNGHQRAFEMGCDVPRSETVRKGDRPMGVDVCGAMMGGGMAACPCSSIAKRHPVVTFSIITIMGLIAVVILTGAILGIVAFLRTL